MPPVVYPPFVVQREVVSLGLYDICPLRKQPYHWQPEKKKERAREKGFSVDIFSPSQTDKQREKHKEREKNRMKMKKSLKRHPHDTD